MDNIERLITDNLDLIGNESPPDGHFERFELKLARRNNRWSHYWIGFLSGIAAVLIIGFFFFFNQKKEENPQMTLSSISKQFAEVEFFYTSSINHQTNRLKDITSILGSDDPTIKMITKELEDYDRLFKQISTELEASPNDERVISAMINYYQTKLEIINRILDELENKQLKSNYHEKTTI